MPAIDVKREAPAVQGASSQPAANDRPDSHAPLGGFPRALRENAEASGLDPIASLFNEASTYASEGHLRLARERLQMLLCMKPDDGEARLLLARVFVAGSKWQDALTALDEAQQYGVSVPVELRIAVEDNLRDHAVIDDEQRSALRAREQGEIKALRQEARRLRSENAQLVSENAVLERETRKWAWITVGVSVMASLFIAANVASSLFSAATAGDPVQLAATESTAAPTNPIGTTDGVLTTEAAAPPTVSDAPGAASRAAQALTVAKGLEGTQLDVTVRGGKAIVGGTVTTHRQRKLAEDALAKVSGLDAVDLSGVEITARTRGAKHAVKRGETLGHIAIEYYGDSRLASTILRANKGANSLSIGQELIIPPIK